MTTHTTLTTYIHAPPVGFEPTIPAGEQPQTYALDRAATGNGKASQYYSMIYLKTVTTPKPEQTPPRRHLYFDVVVWLVKS